MTTLRDIIDNIPDEERAYYEKMDSVAERIIRLMELRGLNQEQLAKKMGKHKSYISRVLGGGVNLTLKTISEFEHALEEDVLTTPKSSEAWEVPPRRAREQTEPLLEEASMQTSREETATRAMNLPSVIWTRLMDRSEMEGVLPETLAVAYLVTGMAEDASFKSFPSSHLLERMPDSWSAWNPFRYRYSKGFALSLSEPRFHYGPSPEQTLSVYVPSETVTESDDGSPQDALLRLLYGMSRARRHAK